MSSLRTHSHNEDSGSNPFIYEFIIIFLKYVPNTHRSNTVKNSNMRKPYESSAEICSTEIALPSPVVRTADYYYIYYILHLIYPIRDQRKSILDICSK